MPICGGSSEFGSVVTSTWYDPLPKSVTDADGVLPGCGSTVKPSERPGPSRLPYLSRGVNVNCTPPPDPSGVVVTVVLPGSIPTSTCIDQESSRIPAQSCPYVAFAWKV